MNYIDVDTVKAAMRSSYSGEDDSLLTDQIIPACSTFLDNYCNRPAGSFLTTTLDELYHGTGTNLMFLNATPVQSISRLATTSTPCLQLHNTSSDMGVRATCAITPTGLVLTYIANAVTTTQTFLFSTYPTINALAAAVNGAGNNWQSQAMGGFGTWSSADLRSTQGAFGARIVTAYFFIHWQELSFYRVNELNGEVYSTHGFHRGSFNWRCSYTAGYTAFPNDLTQALAEMCAQTYFQREANANMSQESNGEYSYTRMATKAFEGLSDMARRTLGQYKRRPVQKFSTW